MLNTDKDFKSILEQGTKSPFLEEVDEDSAKKLVELVKGSKELVENSLEYKTDSNTENTLPDKIPQRGDNLVNHLQNWQKAFKILEGIVTGLDLTNTADEALHIRGYWSIPDENKYNVYSKFTKFFVRTRVGLDMSIAYATYSEEVSFYNQMKEHITDNITPENAQKSREMLKVIDEHISEATKQLGLSKIDALGDIANLELGGIGVKKASEIGAWSGTRLGPLGRAAGAIWGGVGGYAAITSLINMGIEKAKWDYVNRGDYGYVPTWNDITGKKSDSHNTPVRLNAYLPSTEKELKSAVVTLSSNSGNNAFVNDGDFALIITGKNEDAVLNQGSYVTIEGNDGGDYIESMGDDVLINGSKGNDSISNAGNNVTTDGGSGDNYIANEGDYVTIKALEGNNTINNYAGKNISIVAGAGSDSIVNAVGSDITIDAGNGNNILENYGGNGVQISSGSGKDIVENHGNLVKISSNKGNDTIITGGNSNTITGGKGNDFIYLQDDTGTIIKYSSGDGNDTIYGFNSTSILSVDKGTYSTVVSDADIVVTVGKGKVTLDGAASLSALNINGTDIMSLTLTNDSDAKVTLESPIKTANASSRTSAIRIVGNAFNNSIVGGSKNDSLYGGNGNDYLSGEQGNDKIYGQNGADSLLGGSGNDTLTGGKDNDFFIYSAGNDVIADFTAGQDKIQIASGKISKTSLSGSDVLFTIGKGSLTVKNAKGKTISLLDSTGKASSTVVGAQALTNSNKASVTIGADMGFVDASKSYLDYGQRSCQLYQRRNQK